MDIRSWVSWWWVERQWTTEPPSGRPSCEADHWPSLWERPGRSDSSCCWCCYHLTLPPYLSKENSRCRNNDTTATALCCAGKGYKYRLTTKSNEWKTIQVTYSRIIYSLSLSPTARSSSPQSSRSQMADATSSCSFAPRVCARNRWYNTHAQRNGNFAQKFISTERTTLYRRKSFTR